MSDLDTAITIAVQAHAGLLGRDGQPAILHPLRVMLALSDPTDRIVGVLHDVAEDPTCRDGSFRRQAIDKIWSSIPSSEVWSAMHVVSRIMGEGYDDYIDRCAANAIARRVKIADLRDHLDPARAGSLPSASYKARAERALARLLEAEK